MSAVARWANSEGQRSRWIGRASNPVGGAMRRWVGSTPMPLRQRGGGFALAGQPGGPALHRARCVPPVAPTDPTDPGFAR